MGRPRMPEPQRQRLQELILSELVSDTEIAERLGLSRRTVRLEREGLLAADGGESLCHLAAGETYASRPIRCTGCGGLVRVLPCRLCRCRERLQRERDYRRRAATGLGAAYHRTPLKQQSLFEAAGDSPDLPPPKAVQIAGRFTGLHRHFKRRD